MKPKVDHSLCIGCGNCEGVCPDVFELQSDGHSHVINDNPDAALKPLIDDAIDQCPVSAISWSE